MFWVNQKYCRRGVPLAWFGVLLAGYNLIDGSPRIRALA